MAKALYTVPPPACREGVSRFLKIIPIAALLAAGFAPQAWANSGGMTHPTSGFERWYIGDKDGDGTGKATGNTNVIVNGTGHDYAYGGYSTDTIKHSNYPAGPDENNFATGNTLTIALGGTVKEAFGGGVQSGNHLKRGEVRENTLIIDKSTVTDLAAGGYSNNGSAENNKVVIRPGSMVGTNPNAKTVYGGYAGYFSATGNEVLIEGGEVTGAVHGGYAYYFEGNATGNTVTITGGTVTGDVTGGYAYTGESNATGNIVTISDGTVTGDVRGGRTASGDATNNTVILTGNAVVKGYVFGASCGKGSATHNTVILSGNAVVEKYVSVGSCGRNSRDEVSGNILKVQGKNLEAQAVYNVETIEFTLPADFDKDKDVALDTGYGIDLTGVTITVDASSITPLKPGETITLIDNVNGSKKPKSITVSGGSYEGALVSNELIIRPLGSGGIYTVTATADPVAGGTISCKPTPTVKEGEEVECTATANPGYTLEKLEISDGTTTASCTTSPSCTATLTGVKGKVTATATFKDSGGGGGSFALGVDKIDGDISNKNLLQPGRANTVEFTLGKSFDGSGTLDIAGAKRALQKASPSSTPVTITDGYFTAEITPEAGEKTVTVTLTVKDITMDKNTYTFTVAGSGGGGGGGGGGAVTGTASPVPTLGEVGLLLSGIALAGAAAPALRRRERKERKQA